MTPSWRCAAATARRSSTWPATSTPARSARWRRRGARRASRSGPVVLNFAGADYINSTGIALIVGLLARARAGGVPIRACGLSDHYREIFEITRLADFMPIATDEDSAVDGAERTGHA